MHDGRSTLLSRRPRRGLRIAADSALALVLMLLVGLAGSDRPATLGYTGPDWLIALVATAIALPIALRRVWPLPMLAVITAALALATVTGMAWGESGIPFLLPMMIALYSVGSIVSRRPAVLALTGCLLGTSVAIILASSASQFRVTWGMPGSLVIDWLLLTAPWVAGRAVRAKRAYTVKAAEQLARQAVTDERLRIARELHDIVAHSLSLITVKASIANHVAAQRPDEAQAALRVIEDTSRGTLTEMRRLLGVLRSESTAPELAPSPGLAGLPELAERAGLAGVRVDLAVDRSAELPDGVELSVYRIVQEALTNVVKHAGAARAQVVVGYHDQEVTVEVTDDGGGVGAPTGDGQARVGHGLIGMRERVAAFGGDLEVGPRPDGGFRVAARLPFAAEGR